MRAVLGILLAISILGSPALAERRIVAPEGTDLGLPFSPGVLSGDFLYLSGAIGNIPGSRVMKPGVVEQTKQAMENLRQVLSEAGLDASRVVQTDLFLTDMRYYVPAARAYGEFVTSVAPAFTAVEADIALPGALAEIAMVAARPGVEITRVTPKGWPEQPPGFSWGLLAGDTLFVSGMASTDPATGRFLGGSISEQTRRALTHLGSVLQAADMSYRHVVGCRVYLADAREFQEMNATYRSFFPQDPPVRATIRAASAQPDLGITVQCNAVRGDKQVVAAGPPPSSPLSPGIRVGDRLFLSGMVGRAADGYPEGVAAQTKVTLDRLRRTLEAGGRSFGDVISATVFLTDIRHYDIMNKIYAEVVGSPAPARATVGSQLMSADALVEIQMTAEIPAAEEKNGGTE